MKSLSYLSLCLFFLVYPSSAQRFIELEQLHLDLGNSSVLMALSAHPDDEDGATLAYYRMKHGIKTYSIFFSRGEGGQNEIGSELYKDLGVIRTRETEEAAEILGSEVFFLNFIDFGYSKTATETFERWGGRTEVLRRLVYIVRKLKPDVLIMNHNPIDGHGNHQVVAIAAIEAFDAAADPTFAPEQLTENGVDLWQPKKLFWRAQRFTGERREPVDVFAPIGMKDSLRHQSYQEIARAAISMHKSQGMDRFAVVREMSPSARTMYRLVRSSSKFENDSTNFFGGIEPLRDNPRLSRWGTTLKRLGELTVVASRNGNAEFLTRLRNTLTDPAMSGFNDVSGSLNTRQCSKNFSPIECRTVGLWTETLRRLTRLYHDVNVDLEIADSVVVPGQRFSVRIGKVSPKKWQSALTFSLQVPRDWVVEKKSEAFTVDVPRTANPTLPLSEGMYRSYQSTPLVTLHATLKDLPSFYLEVPTPNVVAPHQTLNVVPKAVRLNDRGNEFQFTVHNYFNNKTAGRLQIDLPIGWTSPPTEFVIDKENGETTGTVTIVPGQKVAYGDYRIVFHAHNAADTVLIRNFGVSVTKDAYVGIIQSYDNTLETALKELGVKYKLLNQSDLAGNLQGFSSIIIDIRAYLVRDDLKKNNSRLLEYVQAGGNLIVMYHKDFEWKSEYAPYPLTISRDRVVDETAPIRVLQLGHPLFNFPNKISSSDWDGWVQERGLYFPGKYSKEYVELLSSNDPDEAPLNGGYLIATYGKGTYIYTSYVWYRQWKDVHPGALRILANMISLPFSSTGR